MGAWGEGTLNRSAAANQSGLARGHGRSVLVCPCHVLEAGECVCVYRGVRGGGGKFWKVPELLALARAEEPG